MKNMKIRMEDTDLTINITIEVLAHAEYFDKKRITKSLNIIIIIITYHISLTLLYQMIYFVIKIIK